MRIRRVKVQLPSFLTSELDRGEWPTSTPAALPPGKNHGTHWPGGLVDPRPGLDVSEKTKIPYTYRDSNPGPEPGSVVTIPTTFLLHTERLLNYWNHTTHSAHSTNIIWKYGMQYTSSFYQFSAQNENNYPSTYETVPRIFFLLNLLLRQSALNLWSAFRLYRYWITVLPYLSNLTSTSKRSLALSVQSRKLVHDSTYIRCFTTFIL